MQNTIILLLCLLFLSIHGVLGQNRCGTLNKNSIPLEDQTASSPRSETFQIRVVFHIVLPDSLQERISLDRIQSQIEALNRDFNRRNDDLQNVWPEWWSLIGNAKMRFCLGSHDSNRPLIFRKSVDERNFMDKFENGIRHIQKSELGGLDAFQPNQYVNVWIGESATLAGFSTFPQSHGSDFDGILLDYRYVGSDLNQVQYGLGRTLVHEVGHYFGLLHPWGEGCSNHDDIEDTPVQSMPYFSCTSKEEAINCEQLAMTQNFMQFSDDACLLFFTQQQVERMQQSLLQRRFSLLENTACYDSIVPEAPTFHYNYLSQKLIIRSLQRNQSYILRVYDLNGSVLDKRKSTSFDSIIDIDLAYLPRGIYFAQLSWENGTKTLKILL